MKSTKRFLLFLSALAIFTECSPAQFVPDNYTEEVHTGAPIESKYLRNGTMEVGVFEQEVEEDFESIVIYYPVEMTRLQKKYPVVVFVNGTGVTASKYAALFRHLASWGFIVVGNEERESWDGVASEKSLAFLLDQDEEPESIFYNKVDRDNIGASGHSQGGAGVFTTITEHPNSNLYKTAVSLSPTHEEQAISLKWHYDLTRIRIPILLVAGTSGSFETKFVIPFDKMSAMYEKIPSPKVMMRRTGCEHGQMLYSADGYVSAWFMWQLKGDAEAAVAFTGESPEILGNRLYQDQRVDI